MNALKTLTILILIIAMISCKKDDPKDDLAGTWKITKYVATACTDPTDNQSLTFIDGCYKEALSGFELCQTAVFNKDNTYSLTTKSTLFGSTSTDVESGTFTATVSTLKLCPTGEACDDSNYTLSGKTLTINKTDNDTKCKQTLTLAKQ
jgi:hypothetical protein